MGNNYMVISDVQIPFEHQYALKFFKAVKKEFKVSDDNVLCDGDELDCVNASRYPKDPEAIYTPNSELIESRRRLKAWYEAFPRMRLGISNHGLRWLKKASAAEIPSQLIRSYKELIGAPAGWEWREEWIIREKHPFRMIHGCGYNGMNGHRTAALDAGMSTVIGHLHSHAGVAIIRTKNQYLWGLNAGCCIDVDAYAFKYEKDNRFKPALGGAVIIDNGKTPIWLPLERFL